jgi:arsenite-transporting ATPase
VRVVLFTGEGGVGKTTTAASTAAVAAASGRKTLVLSADPARSLGDTLAVPLGHEAVEVDGGLFALQVETQQAFEDSWHSIQDRLGALLDAGGIERVDAGALTVLPGAEDVLTLLALRDAARSGRYDLICVDCPATAQTVRLLQLPEALSWWLGHLFPVRQRLARAVRPQRGAAPTEAVFDATERLVAELDDVRGLLADPDTTSVRLVLTPETAGVAAARRDLTALALHGCRVDGVVANRVFPPGGSGWQAGWAAAQRGQLEEIRASFGARALWQATYAATAPVGFAALADLGARTYADTDPAPAVSGPDPLSVHPTAEGFALHLALPFVTRAQVELARRDADLVITVRGHRRVLTLPSGLQRCTVDSARLVDGVLIIGFVPDPALWMRP